MSIKMYFIKCNINAFHYLNYQVLYIKLLLLWTLIVVTSMGFFLIIMFMFGMLTMNIMFTFVAFLIWMFMSLSEWLLLSIFISTFSILKQKIIIKVIVLRYFIYYLRYNHTRKWKIKIVYYFGYKYSHSYQIRENSCKQAFIKI